MNYNDVLKMKNKWKKTVLKIKRIFKWKILKYYYEIEMDDEKKIYYYYHLGNITWSIISILAQMRKDILKQNSRKIDCTQKFRQN